MAEAMWKATPVIGGNVGGIRYQIEDGVSGFLVSSIEETAKQIVKLVNNKELRDEMGRKARESVRKNFLLTRVTSNSTSISLTRCKPLVTERLREMDVKDLPNVSPPIRAAV